MELYFAQVARAYPHTRTCEIILLHNGQRLQGVPMLSGMVTSDTGFWSAHAMQRPPSEEEAGGLFSEEETLGPDFRSVTCVVAYTHGRAFIIGFMPHPLTQMAFVDLEQNRDAYRHPAGTMATTNKYGDFTLSHTGGAFFKFAWPNASGVDPDRYEDLTQKTANDTWELQENEPVTVTLSTGNRDAEAFKIRVRPNGDVDQMSSGYWHLRHAKDLHHDIGEQSEVHITLTSTHSAGLDIKIRTPENVTVTAGGDARVQALGDAYLTAGDDATVEAIDNVYIKAGGDVRITAGGDIEATVGGDAEIKAAGSATVESKGDLELFSPSAINMTSTVINATTPLFNVVGVFVEEGQAFLAEAAVLAKELSLASDLAGMAGDLASTEENVAAAEEEVEAARADIEEAAENIRLAVEEAVLTSEEAVGTAPPDNEGLTGDPAPDLPIV